MLPSDRFVLTLEKVAPILEGIQDRSTASSIYGEIVDSLRHDRLQRAEEANRLWAYRRFSLWLAFILGIGTMLIAGFSVYTSGGVSIGTGIMLSSVLGLGSAFLWGFRPQRETDNSSASFAQIAKFANRTQD